MTLGEIVRQYRQENHLTMEEFSKRCGLSKGYISMLESDKNPNTQRKITPSFATIRAIALALSISTNDIISLLDSDQPITWNETNNDTIMFELTKKEELLIKKYRENTHMQDAVNKLLGIE